MLIKVKKSGESFYGRRGSTRMRKEDESRYNTRRGMANVALDMREGKPMNDVYGNPLPSAKRLSDSHSRKTIEGFSRGEKKFYSFGNK